MSKLVLVMDQELEGVVGGRGSSNVKNSYNSTNTMFVKMSDFGGNVINKDGKTIDSGNIGFTLNNNINSQNQSGE